MININNFNSLLFIDKYKWDNKNLSPRVILLTAWTPIREDKIRQLEPLVKKLMNLGCEYFICVGNYSEDLHDLIDEIILDISFKNSNRHYPNIVTTWHDNDTNEEVADFFLHATNVNNGLLVAFLDTQIEDDCSLKQVILKKLK